MSTTRKNASRVTAIIGGEPTTIRSGDTVTVLWTRYGTAPAGTTHTEGAADRDPAGTGRFVALVDPAYKVGRNGQDIPAILLVDQVNVKDHNADAYRDADGEPVGRWLPLYRADGTPTTQLAAVHTAR